MNQATQRSRVDIGFDESSSWRESPALFDDHTLKIQGHPVMEDWETSYMKELAKISSTNGGVVLEVGFGMGISAGFIQQANIERHIIIEANHEVCDKAREFSETAPGEVVTLEGFWEEVIGEIPDNSLNGILFDTYPLSEGEIHKNHFSFFASAYKKLAIGGVLTYYSDEIDKYRSEHLQKLVEAGFRKGNIKSKIIAVNPPKDCLYWQAKTILAPIVTK